MDVHRSRFVPYPTSAISAIAFSRNSDSNYSAGLSLKLALGRANGSIEIWDPRKGLWNQEVVFEGDAKKSIDGLVWTQDPDERDAEDNLVVGQHRLFSISSTPAVTEWDLATGQAKRRSTGNFSDVWCVAAQAKAKVVEGSKEEVIAQDIVGGCGDGTLVLLTTKDDDLQFKRLLARVSGKRARCMSVAYKNRDIVVAGFADSMIRIFDTRNGSLIRNMSLGAGIPGAPKNAMVWQVRCLPSGDIVSGDSNGEVRFWDGKTYTLQQRLTAHDADCLDMVVSSDGKTIFSGGLDGRIAIFEQTTTQAGVKTWAKKHHRRVHRGEVKALAAYDSKHMSVVVSGGSDFTPVVTPLREYGKENIRGLPSLPEQPPVTSAPRARLLVSWWDKYIYVWRIARQHTQKALPEEQRPRKLVAKITLDTRQDITSVSITHDGRLLAASTASDVKVFQLRKRLDSDALAIRKIEVPDDLADDGARLLAFSPDGKWLAAISPENDVQVVRCVPDATKPKHIKIIDRVVELDRQRRHATRQTGFKGYDRAVTRMTFDPTSSVFVVSDPSGHIDSWVLEGHEDLTAPALDLASHDSDKESSATSTNSDSDSDSDDEDALAVFHGQHWTDNPSGHLLPKLDSAPLILSFRPPQSVQQTSAAGNPGVHSTRHNPHAHAHTLPSGPFRLLVLTATHQLYEFDLLAGRLSDWSRRNPSKALLPEDFTKVRDRAMGLVWDVKGKAGRERVWIYGSTWVFMVDVSEQLTGGGAESAVARKRRASQLDGEGAGKRIKGGSGAGSRLPVERQAGRGGLGKVRVTGEGGEVRFVDPEERRERATSEEGHVAMEDDDDDDDIDVDAGAEFGLARLRNGEGVEADGQLAVKGDGAEERKWWGTFKYRPILGMVPLEDEVEGPSAERMLEVVLVERPLDNNKAKK